MEEVYKRIEVIIMVFQSQRGWVWEVMLQLVSAADAAFDVTLAYLRLIGQMFELRCEQFLMFLHTAAYGGSFSFSQQF